MMELICNLDQFPSFRRWVLSLWFVLNVQAYLSQSFLGPAWSTIASIDGLQVNTANTYTGYVFPIVVGVGYFVFVCPCLSGLYVSVHPTLFKLNGRCPTYMRLLSICIYGLFQAFLVAL